jgi:hypothetical protein
MIYNPTDLNTIKTFTPIIFTQHLRQTEYFTNHYAHQRTHTIISQLQIASIYAQG